MKVKLIRVFALLLAAVLTFSGCDVSHMAQRLGEFREQVAENAAVNDEITFSQMEYVRPDMEAFQAALEASCEAAGSDDLDTVVDAIWAFYDVYDWFYT